MRIAWAILPVCALAGCGGVELLTATAIHGELQAQNLKAVQGQTAMAGEMMGKTNLQRAINAYQAEKGHWPPSLEDLAPTWIPAIPKHADGSPYGYDPSTGQILDHPAPVASGPTPNDLQKMAAIRAAIDQYGQAIGYYPPSLQALVPTYLAEVPKTDSGQDFLFDPQNGALSVPVSSGVQQTSGPAPRPQPPPSAGVSGVGPMGEVMTGIGIQNELNRGGGGSAVDSAGGYSRRKIGDIGNNYGQQQEKVMDNLGL